MQVIVIIILFHATYLQETLTNLDSIGIAFAYTFLEYTVSPSFFSG